MSIFLDALRFLAAIVVVVGHLTQPVFSTAWPDLAEYSVVAVSVFFVLSGFVISHVAATREHDPIGYTVARIARLYSVLVPAVVLSGVVQIVCVRLDPVYLAHWTGPPGPGLWNGHPFGLFAYKSVAPLTFLNSIHSRDHNPDLDVPMWSLGFEAPYYAIFGIAIFTRRGRRIVLLLLSALLFGVGILRLLPVWLAGVALHRVTLRLPPTRARSLLIAVPCLVAVAAGCVIWPAFSAWSQLPHSRGLQLLLHGTGHALDAYLYYYWGVLTSLLILAATALDAPLARILIPLEKPIRWCAGQTFSLYLFHFPLLILAYAATHYNRASALADSAAGLAVILSCFLLSSISESRKRWWRNLIQGAAARIAAPKTAS
jgi:peptidoglycan/LPS O-acetylase OafA/YrhL